MTAGRARSRALVRRGFPHGRADALLQVLLFAAAYYAYRLTRGAIDDPQGTSLAFANARDIISIERAVGLFFEADVQASTGGRGIVTDVASWIYINAQTTIVLSALIFMYCWHNAHFRFVRNMFLVAMGIALLGYALYPTAPPRFFPEWGFTDSVAAFTGVDNQNPDVSVLFNPYAAVPSMHVCNAVLIGWSLARVCRHVVVRCLWALYPIVMLWVVLVTANHWTVDAILGAMTAAVAFIAARVLARARPSAWTFGPAPAQAPLSGR